MSNIYSSMARELASILRRYKNRSTGGVWHRNKQVKKEVDNVLAKYRKIILSSITNSTTGAWKLSDSHNDEFVRSFTNGIDVPEKLNTNLFSRNDAALKAFHKRAVNGIKISDRVWNLTNQTQDQLETFIGEGLSEGRSAIELTKDLKRYLKEPEKRFRRLKNPDTGKLILSNPASNYNPGRGVYRSSYKNALRLARNEINIAYRTADHERRKNLPFVMGVKVNLSPTHPKYDICDELQGEYPKNFVFTGWHPNCLCFTTTKLMSRDEFKEYLNSGQLPERKNVNTIPKNAQAFISENSERMHNLKSKPYFIQDNFVFKDGEYLLKKKLN